MELSISDSNYSNSPPSEQVVITSNNTEQVDTKSDYIERVPFIKTLKMY